jgi:hypothetical protein
MNALQRVSVTLLMAGPALVALAGPVSAGAVAAPAVKGVGALQCAASGKVKFNPALGSSSISTSVTVAVDLTGCHGSNAGATVAGGQITGTLTGTPAGDCGTTSFSTQGTLTVTYDVKSGHPKLKPTTLSFNAVQSVTDDPGFEGQVSGAVTGGSFPNDGSFLVIQSAAGTPCSAKWKAGATSSFEEG